MRILHLINYYQPKIGYQEYFLAKKQQELGHEVFFITSDRYFPFHNYKKSYEGLLGPRIIEAGKFIEDGITVYRKKPLLEIILPFVTNSFIFFRDIKNLIYQINPDLIVCHGTTIPLSIQLARIQFNSKKPFIIYDDHQGYPAKNKVWLHKLFGKIFSYFYLDLILKSQDRIVATSDDTKQTLIDNYGFSSNQIVTAPVGVEINSFYFSSDYRLTVRGKYDLIESDILSIYTGKISYHKGIPELLEAVSLIRNKFDNFYLLLIGFIQDEELLSVIESAKGVYYSESVSNSDLYKYFSAADFGIWPNHVTISHYEAMACKLPIIVSSYDVAKERVKWENGFSLNSLSVDEIYKHCITLISDKALRKKMGEKSFEAIKRELSWDVIVEKFLI